MISTVVHWMVDMSPLVFVNIFPAISPTNEEGWLYLLSIAFNVTYLFILYRLLKLILSVRWSEVDIIDFDETIITLEATRYSLRTTKVLSQMASSDYPLNEGALSIWLQGIMVATSVSDLWILATYSTRFWDIVAVFRMKVLYILSQFVAKVEELQMRNSKKHEQWHEKEDIERTRLILPNWLARINVWFNAAAHRRWQTCAVKVQLFLNFLNCLRSESLTNLLTFNPDSII